MENWKVKLKLNQLQPRIFDNNPASIRGFSYEADANSDTVKVVHWLTCNHRVFASSDHIFLLTNKISHQMDQHIFFSKQNYNL